MDLVQFGEYLRSLRQEKGLTLTKLAEESGVSHPYLSQIENGKKNNYPSSEVLIKLAGPLGVDYEELMEKAGHLPSDSFRSNLTAMLEKALSVTTINNQFFDFLMDDVKQVERKYEDCLEEGERITPEWLRSLVSKADWKQEWIFDLVKEFVIIAKKHDLDFEEIARKRQKEEQTAKELTSILQQSNITYCGHQLTQDDQQRILDMLAVLFKDRKE